MSYVNNFLNRLQKVKQVGNDRYTALCPVHDDKNPSMTIKIVEDKNNQGSQFTVVILFTVIIAYYGVYD